VYTHAVKQHYTRPLYQTTQCTRHTANRMASELLRLGLLAYNRNGKGALIYALQTKKNDLRSG